MKTGLNWASGSEAWEQIRTYALGITDILRPEPSGTQKACISSYFWQKSWPQFLQWCRLSVRENRTEQPEQLSPPSSFTQWSAAERPGWSLTDQLNTRPRLSPTRILLWSLQETQHRAPQGRLQHSRVADSLSVTLQLSSFQEVVLVGGCVGVRVMCRKRQLGLNLYFCLSSLWIKPCCILEVQRRQQCFLFV